MCLCKTSHSAKLPNENNKAVAGEGVSYGQTTQKLHNFVIKALTKIIIVLIVISAQFNLYWHLDPAIGQSVLYSLKTQAHAFSYRM